MGHWIECEKCKKLHRYDPGEIENTGTVWHPIWTVKCGNCGSTITFDQGVSNSLIELRFHKQKKVLQ